MCLSSREAEVIAMASFACQSVRLKKMLGKLVQNQGKPTIIRYDSSSAVKLRCLIQNQFKSSIIHCDSSSVVKTSKNPVIHGRSKHIDVRFHFLRELTKDGTVVGALWHTGTIG